LEVNVQQGNFKILRLLLQLFLLFWVEKWIPPSRLETVEIGLKTEGILGVKVRSPIPWVYSAFYTMYYWMILTAIL
jgi:hypothetical protein